MINEIKRMQQLAGLNEAFVNKPTNLADDPLYQIFNETKEEYDNLVGTDPIYKGLEIILNDSSLYEDILKTVEEELEEYEYDEEEKEEYRPGLVEDYTNYTIMEKFAPTFIYNLLDAGFTYNKSEDEWTISQQYQVDGYESLTSYGIIWDILGIDFDTNPRERIGDILKTTANKILP
jgi:hypothetical protein